MYPSHQKSALQAYQRTQSSAMSPKQTEVLAFNRAAAQLKRASEDSGNFTAYAEALRFNQRLWTAVQASLLDNPERVPEPVRTNMLNLSLFIDKHTLDALQDPRAEKLSSLIEINLAMAGGLFENARHERTLN